MFRVLRSRPCPPTIDLSTVRETLLYMHDDMKRAPELAGVASAISAALAEIEKVEHTAPSMPETSASARFMPSWSRG